MQPWYWLAGGLILLVLELVTPSGFFIMFFGLGAFTVGLLMAAGMMGGAWAQWLLFSVFSLVYLALFRRRVQARLEGRTEHVVDDLVGDLAVPQQRIEPGAVGPVEVRGSHWSARNDDPAPLGQGQRCRVVRVNGLELVVTAER